jgi:putative Mg2+ transporter-C (MgtC) family protein
MNLFWEALHDELTLALPDTRLWVRVTFRLLMAVILATIIGWEREREGKAAGLRTHVLVAMGACVFVLAVNGDSTTPSDVSRVVQGITTGIGFIGGGVIFKFEQDHRVKGLTTAAGVWLTAAIGVAAGLGHAPVAILGALLCWMVLVIFHTLEKKFAHNHKLHHDPHRDPD